MGKSVHGDLQSADDDDGVNIGEDMKNSIQKKASEVMSLESPSVKAEGNRASNEMIANAASVASKGSLGSPDKVSPTRKKSIKKLPQPQSSQHGKSIDSKRSRKRGAS